MSYTFDQLAALWFEAHGDPTHASIAAAVAIAESNGNPDARSPAGAIGLWQIYPPAHPNYDPARLTEPLYNATAAVAISNNGTDWRPWDVAWTDGLRGTSGGTYAPTGASPSGRIYQAHGGAAPPGGGGGPAAKTPPTKPPPKHQTPATQLPDKVSPPGAHAPRSGNVLHNWSLLTGALGRTLPTQDYEARKIVRRFTRAIR